MKLAALIVSIAAILISSFTLYLNYLRPFSPVLASGDPMWTIETLEREVKQLALIVPIIFTNEGARPGIIVELMLTLHSYTEAKDLKFFPALELNYPSFLKGRPRKESVFQHLNSTFTPIFLEGKESLMKTFVFFCKGLLPPEGIKTGRYRVDFFYLKKDDDKEVKFHSANYNITVEQLNLLKKLKAVAPMNEERNNMRQR